MIRFDLPVILHPDKQLSPFTVKNYRACLNKLAMKGFGNIQLLQDKPAEVVKIIDTILEGQSDHKYRIMYSAIFYALADTDYKTKSDVYYKAFRKHVNSEEKPDRPPQKSKKPIIL